MGFIGIIPARYASTRFPGKPLALVHGKPMIQVVYEHVHEAGLDRIEWPRTMSALRNAYAVLADKW